MEEYLRELDQMLEADGGFEKSYLKLIRMAAELVRAAIVTKPGNRALRELEPIDLVHTAFERLISDGPGEVRPYYALRNFVRNKIRTLSKSPAAFREVPVGGNEDEWSDFWDTTHDPTEHNPGIEAELREAADLARKIMFRLRAEFNDDDQVLEILAAWELGFRKRRDIIRESNLNARTYDAAWKRLKRKAARIWKDMEHE